MIKFKNFDKLTKNTTNKIIYFYTYLVKTLSRYDIIIKIIRSEIEKHRCVTL